MWKANQVRPTRSKKKILFFVSTENFFSRLVCCPQSSLFILIQNGFHTSKSLNTASTLQSHSTRLPHFKATQTASTLHKATLTASTLHKATQTASTLHKATQTASTLQSHPNSFHTSKPLNTASTLHKAAQTASTLQSHSTRLPHFTKPPKQLPHFKATQTASTLQSHPNSFHTSQSISKKQENGTRQQMNDKKGFLR